MAKPLPVMHRDRAGRQSHRQVDGARFDDDPERFEKLALAAIKPRILGLVW